MYYHKHIMRGSCCFVDWNQSTLTKLLKSVHSRGQNSKFFFEICKCYLNP